MQPKYRTINLLCRYFPCFEVFHYPWFTIMAPLLFVRSTKLHNSEKIKKALCNLPPLRYCRKALQCPRRALDVGPPFNVSPLSGRAAAQHNSYSESKGTTNVPSSCCHIPVKGLFWDRRLCHCCHPHFTIAVVPCHK